MKEKFTLTTFFMFFCVSIFLGACSKSPMNYYILESPMLTPKDGTHVASFDSLNPEGPVLAISPVIIPRYLDRPQIVSLSNGINLEFSDTHRWGEDLNIGIERILIESISTHFASVSGIAKSIRLGGLYDYSLFVEVLHFEGERGGKITFDATWILYKKRQIIEQGVFSQTFDVDLTYDDYVRKHSMLLDELGKNIAQNLLQIHDTTKK